MSDLSAFFANNTAVEITEDVVVSERFKNADGKPVPWKVRSLTEAENEEIRKSATRRVKVKGNQYAQETDQVEYVARLIVTSIAFPNLRDAELQKSYGVLGAEALLRKMLLAGEYSALVQKVTEINGFDRDINELVDEAKN